MIIEIAGGLLLLAACIMLPVAVSQVVIAVCKKIMKTETKKAPQNREAWKPETEKAPQNWKTRKPQTEEKPRDVEKTCADFGFERMAALCKMGDIAAMADMAYFFRNRCSESLQRLLEVYERQPVQENVDAIEAFAAKAEKDGIVARAYMMWLVKASLYGNESAGKLIDKCPYYKKKAYIPGEVLAGDGKESVKFWSSDSLWEIGLTDTKRNCTDCSFYYDKKKNCFVLMYVSDYEPPDEDGFGAEWEYENIYFDEFFCRVPATGQEDIPKQLLVLEKEREAFWKNPRHDAPNRKYRWRIPL